MTAVVDASVVLAWLQDEPGADAAEPMLMEGLIGAANWSEALQKAMQHGVPTGVVSRLLMSFGLRVVNVTPADGVCRRSLAAGERALVGGPLVLGARVTYQSAGGDGGRGLARSARWTDGARHPLGVHRLNQLAGQLSAVVA